MRPLWLGDVSYWVAVWAARTCFLGMLALVAISSRDWSGMFPGNPQRFYQIVAGSVTWSIPASAVALSAFTELSRWIGEPWYWHAISKLLEQLQSETFQTLPHDAVQDDHRVTLYRFRAWNFWASLTRACRDIRQRPLTAFRSNWPWAGWLVPVLRAGPRAPGRTVYLACNAERAEGVAGKTYFNQHGTIELKDLPDLCLDSATDMVTEYARRTFVSVEMVSKRLKASRPCARSFQSIRVEVNNRPWGVLMIDSRESRLPNPQKTSHSFQSLAKTLQVLLERAK